MMIVLLILLIFCAIQAIRATHLLTATIWLASVSALVAGFLYVVGAWQIAVIELSVGTGLVTVLMVFAITMVGNANEVYGRKRLPLLITIGTILLLVLLTLPLLPDAGSSIQAVQTDVLWQARSLDLILQVVLIFSGVLGVIGLLSTKSSNENSLSDVPPASLPHKEKPLSATVQEKEAA